MRLKLHPMTVKAAILFVARVHRRLPRVQGGMWSIACVADGEVIGAAIVGSPARVWAEDSLSVLRVAVIEGNPNACSMLYGACSRAARAMGARNLVTYTHADESGVSLRAAGWVDGGLTDGGQWGWPGRPRQLAIDPEPKRRWFAPRSERAKVVR